VRLLQEPPSCERNDWLQTLMHKLPPYQQRPRGALAVAESLARRIIIVQPLVIQTTKASGLYLK
jgi:hypothetical protein